MELIKNLAIGFSSTNVGCIKWNETEEELLFEKGECGLSPSMHSKSERNLDTFQKRPASI